MASASGSSGPDSAAAQDDCSSGTDDGFDDVEMAAAGINMLLNNGFEEAFHLFDKYK